MPLQLTLEDFMTPEQVRRLKAVARRAAAEALKKGRKTAVRDWAILHVALDAGLRVSEIVNLRVGDLLLEPGHAALIVRRGKGGKTRSVHIGEPLRQHLAEFLAWKRTVGEPTSPEAFLFLSPRGGPLTRQAVWLMFKRYARWAGLPAHLTVHSCRHTYASLLYRASRYNLRLVQKQLGHASIRTTQVYADVLAYDALEAVNGLPQ
ncbi:MAG: tyrosine-type recombinase/integrase [Candidatus Bipolaricaulota bacterium]|nr:tyrosine-type recombinase/integrase [Candidatus Bipolaricaulota bacterium]MDW8152109.1 tyrosine-type recombinase/integrase [Candidatus Bipolaricaulota bacterium]